MYKITFTYLFFKNNIFLLKSKKNNIKDFFKSFLYFPKPKVLDDFNKEKVTINGSKIKLKNESIDYVKTKYLNIKESTLLLESFIEKNYFNEDLISLLPKKNTFIIKEEKIYKKENCNKKEIVFYKELNEATILIQKLFKKIGFFK
jgi:hypothetical protein